MEIAYFRVSQDKQTTENQRKECREAIHKRNPGAEILFLDESDLSSRKPILKRPMLQKLLETSKKGDIVTVYSLDRLARRPNELTTIYAQLIDKGVTVNSILQSNLDEGMVAVWAMVAFQERKFISSRTKSGLAQRKAKGQCLGNAPYGYTLKLLDNLPGSKACLIQEPKEQAVIALVQSFQKSGMSAYKICDRLTELGYTNRKANPFHPTSVFRILETLKDPMSLGQSHVA